MSLLVCENLTHTYQSAGSPLTVFSGIDLSIDEGEMVAIVGQSGSGKSTLLHLLGGLDRPTSGIVRYRGQDISSLNESQAADFRNRHVGFVWQVHYLLPEFTALENVMMPLLIRGESKPAAVRQALSRLEAVGLSARATHRSGELSGGEQQRVVLARALVTNPALLLADEPTGNLDLKTGTAIFDLIRCLHRELRLTSVLVTHNPQFAKLCDRALVIEAQSLRPVS